MERIELQSRAEAAHRQALEVLRVSGIAQVWEQAGCRVNIVGSLRMGLMAKHRDIDLHVYSSGVTVEDSFAIAARIAADPRITEVKCINGLHTEESCVAWHFMFDYGGEMWQVDVIHIEEGSRYDGFFERMADRIRLVMTPRQRDTILSLKFEAPDGTDWHGVEVYEAVIRDGINDADSMARWIVAHRAMPQYYWIP